MMNFIATTPEPQRDQRKAARPAQQDTGVIFVSVDDMAKIAQQMENPPKPTAAMLDLFVKYG